MSFALHAELLTSCHLMRRYHILVCGGVNRLAILPLASFWLLPHACCENTRPSLMVSSPKKIDYIHSETRALLSWDQLRLSDRRYGAFTGG